MDSHDERCLYASFYYEMQGKIMLLGLALHNLLYNSKSYLHSISVDCLNILCI